MKVHFIAIGGSAMHNLAIALCQKGITVTGSDDEIFDPAKSRLEKWRTHSLLRQERKAPCGCPSTPMASLS